MAPLLIGPDSGRRAFALPRCGHGGALISVASLGNLFSDLSLFHLGAFCGAATMCGICGEVNFGRRPADAMAITLCAREEAAVQAAGLSEDAAGTTAGRAASVSSGR